MGWMKGTTQGPRRSARVAVAAGAVLVALAAAFVAFELAEAGRSDAEPGMAWPPDAWPSRADLDAHSADAGNETPPGLNCVRGLLFEDERNLPSGGEGGSEFVLEESCRMEAVLEVYFAAGGNLDLRLEGPAGVVFADDGPNVAGPPLRIGLYQAEENPGPHPPGTYRYSFAADGPVDFQFRVKGSP